MAIAQVTVGTSSTLLAEQGSNITLSADIAATVWLSAGVPAEVGKGIKLDLYAPKHTFWGYRNEGIYAIAESGSASIGVHTGA